MRPLEFPCDAGFIDSLHVLVAPAGPARMKIELTANKAAVNPTKNPRERIRRPPNESVEVGAAPTLSWRGGGVFRPPRAVSPPRGRRRPRSRSYWQKVRA